MSQKGRLSSTAERFFFKKNLRSLYLLEIQSTSVLYLVFQLLSPSSVLPFGAKANWAHKANQVFPKNHFPVKGHHTPKSGKMSITVCLSPVSQICLRPVDLFSGFKGVQNKV